MTLQANVDSQLPSGEWPLEALATKMKQYCYLLDDLTAQVLEEQADGDYELLRNYLRQRAVNAFWQKVLPALCLTCCNRHRDALWGPTASPLRACSQPYELLISWYVCFPKGQDAAAT